MKNSTFKLAALVSAALLSACGGGGGSDPAMPTPTKPTAPVVTPTVDSVSIPIVMSVPPATYALDSLESKAYALINAERGRCGFGLLKQNAILDKTAAAHNAYLFTNKVDGHYEDPSKPLFTGEWPYQRISAAGYPYQNSSESIGFNTSDKSDVTGLSSKGIRGLLSAPFHAMDMLAPRQDVGVSIQLDQPIGPYQTAGTVLNYGVPNDVKSSLPKIQALPSDAVLNYPCEGSSGVNTALFGELPNPYPNRNLSINPIGHAIYLMAKSGSNIQVTSSTLLNISTNQSLVLLEPRYGDKEIYPGTTQKYGSALLSNWVFITPDKPLTANTSYKFTVQGTVSGKYFQNSFTYRTGA